MADTGTLTSLANLMTNLMLPMQQNYSKENVFLAELSGVGDRDSPGRFTVAQDYDRSVFSGDNFRYPIFFEGMAAGGAVSETGTWNAPMADTPQKATGTLRRVIQPFTITIDAAEDTLSNSAAEGVALEVARARTALADVTNLFALGNSDALICNVASNVGSGSLVIPLTTPNFNILRPGRVVDILTRSSGADPGSGKRRRIASIDRTANTITVSTTLQASDGGSGNVTFSSAEGVYVPGSYGTLAPEGLQAAGAATGQFEGIDKTTYPGWAGTDGRDGVITSLALSDTMLDAGIELGRVSGVYSWDFGIGDPLVINMYKATKYAMVRYDPEVSTLKSGFKGIVYDGAAKPIPMVKEPMFKLSSLYLIPKETIQVFGRSKGPEFLQDDGSMWRRFARSFPREGDLFDRLQFAYKNCAAIVHFDNLARS